MLSKIVLIGGGGHCHACIDVIESTKKYEILGIIDLKEKVGDKVLGYSVIGDDSCIPNLSKKNVCFLVTLGQIKSASLRKRIFFNLRGCEAKIATVISPLAHVSKHSSIGVGAIIMHHATVGPNVVVGENSIINTGANIEHDSRIGTNCHISTHAVLNGNCLLGNNIFIGSNATIFQNTQVVDDVIVGAGSIVRESIKLSGTFVNNQLIANV